MCVINENLDYVNVASATFTFFHITSRRDKNKGKLLTVLLKLKLWDSRPLAVKVTAKYYISINNGIFH